MADNQLMRGELTVVKLTVLNGRQQGAVAWLIPGVKLTLGNGPEDDVVLRDSTVTQRHATLSLDDKQITLSPEAGPCVSDGKSLELGDSYVLQDNARFLLGEVGLSVSIETLSAEALSEQIGSTHESGDTDDEQGPGPKELLATMNTQTAFSMPPTDPSSGESADSRQDIHGAQTAVTTSRLLPRVLFTTALLSCMVIVWQSGLFRQQPDEKTLDLQAALSELPFAGVSIEQSASSVIVSGFVDTGYELRQLDDWLIKTGFQISNNVIVGEVVGDQVHDIFRVNRIPADVKVSDGVNVVVATREADPGRLDTIEEQVREHVPVVATLTIKNDPHEPAEPDDPIAVDPGKRVELVVSGEPSFIVTADQSRYFVGSFLPTGHRIEAIEAGVVHLVKNGVTTTMKY